MKRTFFWILIGIVCLFFACLSTNYDYDLFARLIVGEDFIEKGLLPFKDYLSYTPTHDWFDHEWGSGVVFYTLIKFLGSVGFIVFQAIMMFGTAFFVVKAQKLQNHSYPRSVVFSVFFVLLFYYLNQHLVRCQLFTFFFFSLFLYILEKHRKFNSRLLYFIPFITIFWNNLHGGVVAGIGLIFLYLLGAIFKRKSIKSYLITLLLSCLVLTINPYGIKYLEFLINATTMPRKYVVEWWSVFNPYHFKHFLPVSTYLAIGFIASIGNMIKKKNFDITKFLIITATLFEGCIHIKLLSLALISISVFCYNDFIHISSKIRKYILIIEKTLPVVILFFAMTIPLYSINVPRADFNKFPLKEVEFLKINNMKGNIVVPFGFGSFVSYKLYPDNLIFMDGRYEEVYNNQEFLTLKNFELGENNWQDIIKNYNTDILMPLKTIEVYKILKNNNDWVLVFEGELCGIFVKNNSVKRFYKQPICDITYYRKTLFNRQESLKK